MTSGQSMMAIGGMVLVGYLSLNFHRAQNIQLSTSITNEALISASGIGQSLLEEMHNLAFDEFTVAGTTEEVDSLTSAVSLGSDTGESNKYLYDDIDDYDGYSVTETLTRLGDFNSSVDVYYVTSANPDTKTFTKTFLKKIDVRVFNSYAVDTLVFSHIFSY